MNKKRIQIGRWHSLGLMAFVGLALAVSACEKKKPQEAAGKELVIGLQCDRSGPTRTIGPFVCDGFHDYIKLFNKKEGLGPGRQVRVLEIDHGYNVPRSVESYERFKEAGVVTVSLFGTPQTYSLTPKLTEDQVLGTTPGFGNAAAADGTKFPYIFPIAATYWSQAASAVKFILDKWEGNTKLKVAYLYYDNPAGREPLELLEQLAELEGFTLQPYAVPPPGIEMRPQVLNIARNYKADWVIAHLFGRAPGVSIKEFARVDFPRERMISLVWGASEADINVAGWELAQGYYGIQFAGVGKDHTLIYEINQMYADEGKHPPKSQDISVYYNRGLFMAAVHARAIQLAVEKHGYPVTSQQVQEAMETVQDFDLDGFLPPLNLSSTDHEGGGWVKVYQVSGEGWTPVSGWMRGYREVVMELVAATQSN